MEKQPTLIKLQLQQFQNLARKVNRLLRSGEFFRMGAELRDQLLVQLKRMYNKLIQFFSRRKLVRILAAAALLLGLTVNDTEAQGIAFGPQQTNPFGLSAAYYFSFPTLADFDGDGDLDIIAGEYYGVPAFYENTGTANAPAFAAPVNLPFGLDSIYSIAFPTSADIDADGDIDLLIGDDSGNFNFHENIGTATAPQFDTAVVNPFGLTQSLSFFNIPTFVDLDSDGDQDIWVSEEYGKFQYYENTGDSANPAYAAPQASPFGIDTVDYYAFFTFADLDMDGDLDVLYSGYNYYNTALPQGNFFAYRENIGSPTAPQYDTLQSNPFNFGAADYFASVRFADLDGDGDMDLFHSEYYGDFSYYENITNLSNRSPLLPASSVKLWPNPATDKVLIDLSQLQLESDAELSLLSMTGKVIATQTLSAGQAEGNFRLGELPPAPYLIRLRTGGQQLTRRFVKQ